MLKERAEISKNDQWNTQALYPSFREWEIEFEKAVPSSLQPAWPALNAFKGKLGENPETLKLALDTFFSISRKLSTLFTYAHLRHDEDIANDTNKIAFDRIVSVLHEFSQGTAWMEPELISLSEETLDRFLSSPILANYRFHIEKIVRIKKHTLSEYGEELLAMAGKALASCHKAFSAINDADFKFGMVTDGQGNERELTHGSYGVYIREQDRTLREHAFKKMHSTYRGFENTICELLNGQVQNHIFNAKARNYACSLDAALFPKNIDPTVYRSLIKTVNDNLDGLHKYVALREKIMNVGPLHLYDMYVPLIPKVDMRMTYEEAEDIVIESVAPLGVEYQNFLRQGLQSHRWVDRFENKNKRSGAYSSGCYDSMPYILMNYKQLLKDVFTLAHEAGHSMHSLLSHKNQPYHYGDYPIFLAEVASTFNEELLMELMLKRTRTKEERIFLINEQIEDIRGTLFRQTMFAEFELSIHELAEKNVPLTPQRLNEIYRELNQRYFGDRFVVDQELESEWARIPHFYYNFYVFQYATGISAAIALATRVLKGGSKEQGDYLSFLKAGCSKYPIDILQSAGIDMLNSQPIAAAIVKFKTLVEQLEKELEEELAVSS